MCLATSNFSASITSTSSDFPQASKISLSSGEKLKCQQRRPVGISLIFSKLVVSYTSNVFAFEVVSALLITAALGAMVLAHSQKSRSKFAQRDLSIARFRKGELKDAAGLPGPGVYALHNAVDVPALLPTGKAAPTSISAVLQARGDIIESSKFQLQAEEEEK